MQLARKGSVIRARGYLHLPWDKSIATWPPPARLMGLTNHRGQTTWLLGLIGPALKRSSCSEERMGAVKHGQIKKNTWTEMDLLLVNTRLAICVGEGTGMYDDDGGWIIGVHHVSPTFTCLLVRFLCVFWLLSLTTFSSLFQRGQLTREFIFLLPLFKRELAVLGREAKGLDAE